MLTKLFFIVLLLVYLVCKSICRKDETFHIDCNGKLISSKIMDDYHDLMKTINHCKTGEDVDNTFYEIEYFRQRWGSNELYDILYKNYCEKHNKFFKNA